MLQRTQISLRADQLRGARRRAADLGISLAEYVRRLIDRDLDSGTPDEFDVRVVIGIGNSGGSNVAKYKDEYLGEAVEAEWRSKTGRTD